MPQRKSHSKSRRGCAQCKQRHVKCDEGIPCGYCVKREITCSLTLVGHQNATPRPVSVSSPVPATAASPAEPGPTARQLELRLMHHYSTSTCHTMEQGIHSRHLWKYKVPELAWSHDFLLDALLELAARHLRATTSPSDPAQAALWDRTALEHQTRALEGMQSILRANLVNESNYEAVFACSIILMGSSLNLPRTKADSPLETILLDFRDLRAFLFGVGVVHNDFAEALRSGAFGVLFTFHVSPGQTPSSPQPRNPAWKDTEVAKSLLALLDDLEAAASSTTNENSKQSLLQALDNLRQSTEAFLAGDVFAGITAWPSAVEGPFLELLSAQQPLALAILALFAVVLHALDDRWWARGAGRRLVKALLPLLLDADHIWMVRISAAFSAVEQWMKGRPERVKSSPMPG